MIILAAAVIITLNNNGIISKANEAVDKTNEKHVQELANLAWEDAYADNVGKSDEELLQALKQSVEKALTDNNLDKEDYGIYVTTTGVTVEKGWLQTSNRTVVKGDTVLNIGEYVNYVSGVEGYTDTNGWQVLGAENGELLVLSANEVSNCYFNYAGSLEAERKEYENAISKLNKICAPYGKGAYATKARSITVEDVDRVTGYDKTTYNKGKISEYGNVVTYTYNGTNKPSYSGANGVTGTLNEAHENGFHWYDENGIYHYVSASDLTNADNNGKEIGKVKSTNYGYTASSATDLKTVAPDAYNMLFGSSDGWYYWLASLCVSPGDYGIRFVQFGFVGTSYPLSSQGYEYGSDADYVRAVVHLSSEYNP